jgi:type IV pilus assembly protein PilE
MKSLRTKGFTLIELMIVVAVIALLVGIAYPSYQESVHKSRRGVGQGALMGLASAMQRFYTEGSPSTYVGVAASGPPGPPDSAIYPSAAPLDGAAKDYNLIIQSAAASTFTLRAIPRDNHVGDKCGTLTLESSGQRGITGGASGVTWQNCWR